MNIFLIFTLLFLLSEFIICSVRFLLRKKQPRTGVRIAVIVFKAVLAIALAALVMAGPVFLRKIQPFMMAMYVALLADSAADLIMLIINAVKKGEKRFGMTQILSLILGVVFFAYGVINMEIVKPSYHTYTSEKLQIEHTFIFAADIHVGSAQPLSVTEKTVKAMNDLSPDFIILGGDITDDYTTKEEMNKVFEFFGRCDCPVYYLYGNHDRQGHAEYAIGHQYTREEYEKAMRDNGIIILKDEFVRISDDLILLGREDITEGESRAKVESLVNPYPEAYLVVADHQPVEFKENSVIGTDLQLSGHTHAGQLFPLRALYSLIGYCFGDYEYEGAVMNVSAGACGWRMPLRTESHCYYEVINLKPAG